MSDWEPLGTVDPKSLVEARRVLHWAAQIASAAGATLLAPREDASHTSLTWDSGALVGAPIGDRRAALRFADLHLLVLDPRGSSVAETPLGGKTLAEGLAWLGEALGGGPLALPMHELPEHDVGGGGSFPAAAHEAYAELARWFEAARIVQGGVFKTRAGASPIRCWPHHFDIATLITLDTVRSIGVGLSPGDSSYAEPYFYVTPWPYPERALTALVSGAWHTAGWTGAVLLASAIVSSSTQHQSSIGFVDAAIDACLELLA